MSDPFEFFRQCGRLGPAKFTPEQRRENARKGGIEKARRALCGPMPAVIRAMFHVIRETGERFCLWEDGERRGFIRLYPKDRKESEILSRIEQQGSLIGNYGPGSTEADAMADYKALGPQRNITGWRKPE